MGETRASLGRLLDRGGPARFIKAATSKEAIINLIQAIEPPRGIDRAGLITAALEREDLMPTCVGHGIALPHPRSPVIADSAEQRVVIGFLETPARWGRGDTEPVHTALLVLSSSAREHLLIISRVHFFCRHERFQRLLRERACLGEIIRAIEEAEAAWN